MSDLLDEPRCDCRINRATGLRCRDCPKRPAPRPVDPRPRSHRTRGATGGLEIPTFLRSTRNNGPLPGEGGDPGRCCED